MPELKWQEHEVIECLGVLPETEEYFASHTFRKSFGSIRLELTIWQMESSVALSMFAESEPSPFVTIHFIVRDRVEFVSEREHAGLKFHDVVVVTGRFWMEHDENHQNWFDRELVGTDIGFELATYPKFELRVF